MKQFAHACNATKWHYMCIEKITLLPQRFTHCLTINLFTIHIPIFLKKLGNQTFDEIFDR